MPAVVDLFSGCGGLALGFQSAGFKIACGVELVEAAAETASYNFHWRFGEESTHICADITKIKPDVLGKNIGDEGCIVIGGPPCQAYSLAGRAKLRSLGKHRINTKDKRGYLYQDFLRFAIGLNARAVVMENVPESTNYGDKNIPKKVCEILEENGYDACWTILNAADYGVPQVRERVFVLAVKSNENAELFLPVPTHRRFDNKITLIQHRFETFVDSDYFRVPHAPKDNCLPWVTVGDAFSDLPSLFPNSFSKYTPNKITMPLYYSKEIQNEFQKEMRGWYEDNSNYVVGNCFRKTERDFPIFERMNPGDTYVEASNIADSMLMRELLCKNIDIDENREEYEKIRKRIVPPYDRENFKNKWQKLCWDKPSHTIVAHLSIDTYSHIHPIEPRGISVREAARLQSFPDQFLFQCSMGDAYKQIGNAVPPLLARAVALQIKKFFEMEEITK